MDIRFVPQEEIDRTKWNSCVHYAHNGNIFGYKWYLDNVAKDWDGLVEGDYESVFPLLWTDQRQGWLGKKERVLHQPELIRASGLYTIHVLSQKRIRSFLEAIPEEYQKQVLHLSEGSRPPSDLGYQIQSFQNQMLLLETPYEQLTAAYSPALQQQLERAKLANVLPNNNIKPEKVAQFYLDHHADASEENAHALQRIMYNALHRGWGSASSVVNSKGDLLAVNFFLYSHKRSISLLPVQSPVGKQCGALAFLFDLMIQAQAEKPMLLDFNTMVADELSRGLGGQEIEFFGLKK